MRNTRWRVGSVAVALVASVVVSAAPVAAARGEVSKDHWDDTFVVPDFCEAIPVTVHDVGHGTTRTETTDGGFLLFSGTGTGTTTLTDADGDAVFVRHSGHFRDLSATDNGDGTVTVVSEVTGKPEQVVGDDGSRLLMDVGRIVFSNTLDYSGTPSNPDDDIFVSSAILDVAGPHPDAESDFARFCEVTLDYFAS